MLRVLEIVPATHDNRCSRELILSCVIITIYRKNFYITKLIKLAARDAYSKAAAPEMISINSLVMTA